MGVGGWGLGVGGWGLAMAAPLARSKARISSKVRLLLCCTLTWLGVRVRVGVRVGVRG